MVVSVESLATSASNDSLIDVSKPENPFIKAKGIIVEAKELTNEERKKAEVTFDEEFRDATVTDFLSIFAGRVAKEAVRGRQKLNLVVDVFTAPVVPEVRKSKRRGIFRLKLKP